MNTKTRAMTLGVRKFPGNLIDRQDVQHSLLDAQVMMGSSLCGYHHAASTPYEHEA